MHTFSKYALESINQCLILTRIAQVHRVGKGVWWDIFCKLALSSTYPKKVF